MTKNTDLPANQQTQVTRKRSPVELSIAGSDILLSGRFHRWQASAFSGSDLDQLSVRIAIDATSPDHLTVDPGEHNLLSFRSRKVEKLQPYAYRATGQLETPAGTHPFDLMVEMPEGHTAFFAISFIARKDVFGDAWSEMVTGGSGAGGIDAERRLDPRAGVRDFVLAAA